MLTESQHSLLLSDTLHQPNAYSAGTRSHTHTLTIILYLILNKHCRSDRGPRSYVMQQLSRPFPTSRNAISDCEDHKVPLPAHTLVNLSLLNTLCNLISVECSKIDSILSQLCVECVFTNSVPMQPRPSHRRGATHHSSTEVSGKEKPVTEERFVALVVDRLRAVIKDREGMTQRVRDGARQQKKNYDEIMVSKLLSA